MVSLYVSWVCPQPGEPSSPRSGVKEFLGNEAGEKRSLRCEGAGLPAQPVWQGGGGGGGGAGLPAQPLWQGRGGGCRRAGGLTSKALFLGTRTSRRATGRGGAS